MLKNFMVSKVLTLKFWQNTVFSTISKIVARPLGNFLLKHPKLMDLSTSSVVLDNGIIMPSKSRVYGQVAPKSFCQKKKHDSAFQGT